MATLAPIYLKTLGEILEINSELIQSQWLAAVHEKVAKSRAFPDIQILDSLPKYILEVAQILRSSQGHDSIGDSLATAREHGSTRVLLGYDVREVAIEYTILREVIVNEASRHGLLPAPVQTELNRISDAGLINAVERFLQDTVVADEKTARLNAETSKRQLNDFFDQAPEPMVIFSGPQHIFTRANQSYIDFINRDPLDRSVRDVFADGGAENFCAILDQVYETGVPYLGKEMLFRKPDESGKLKDHWINIGYYPAQSGGSIVGIHAFVNDVSDQVRARKAVEKINVAVEHERKNFENLFKQTPEMVCMLTGPRHTFRFVNNAHIKVLGFDATGMQIREAQPDSVEVHAYLDQVFATGETAEIFETPITLFDRKRYFNVTFAARRNLQNEIDGVLLLGAEVTEQVLARETLKLQRRSLELAMADAPLVDVLEVMTRMVEFQAGGTLIASVLLSNHEETNLYHGAAPNLPQEYNEIVNGIPIGENIGSCGAAAFNKKTTIVTDIESSPNWTDYKQFPLKFGLKACWSVPILSAKGRLLGTFAFYSKIARAPTEHEIEIVTVAAQTTALIIERTKEIAVRKEAAADAERANAAKSSFLANMSHEIRTPLGAIMGFAELAGQSGTSETDTLAYLQVIERNSVQVLRIIDDILDIAKVEAGKVDLEEVSFSLTEFLADFTSLMGFRAQENGINFSIRAETDLPQTVNTDPTRLRQILTNSVGNAIKFTRKGSVTLHVCMKEHELQFGIVDTGRGISPEQAKNLFQAFVQADVSTTRKFGGTGLGLVLTKRLCQLMGGDYRLEKSELGIGSKFEATIQVGIPAASEILAKRDVVFAKTAPKIANAPRQRLDGVSVLLVEDAPDNQVLVKLILERQGAILSIAGDGVAGVEKALAGEFDVVLMDIQMPLMDGHEAVRILRQNHYTRPVIALTAHAMKEESARARESGFTNFLSKPIQREEMISMVAEYAALSPRPRA